MTRKLTILTFVLIFCIISCRQAKNETNSQGQQTIGDKIDMSVVAILPFDTTQYWVFKNNKPTNLTNDDLLRIETILNKCISDYNPDQERKFKELNTIHPNYKRDKENFIIDLTRYKRQYVATINFKGEKEVWVNCFCDSWGKNWKESLIFVLDGGNCYFNLKINLTTGEYYELMVNGDA